MIKKINLIIILIIFTTISSVSLAQEKADCSKIKTILDLVGLNLLYVNVVLINWMKMAILKKVHLIYLKNSKKANVNH